MGLTWRAEQPLPSADGMLHLQPTTPPTGPTPTWKAAAQTLVGPTFVSPALHVVLMNQSSHELVDRTDHEMALSS